MLTHEFKKRVRYGETDQMGYLYYGNYAQYYEIGRAELIRTLGLTYREMEEVHGIIMPVVSMQVRYLRPARYDELITIHTELRKLPDRYITFNMELFNEAGERVNAGTVRLCFVKQESGESVPTPDFLMEKLKEHFA